MSPDKKGKFPSSILEFKTGVLYLGNCLDIMRWMKRKNMKVDLVFGSPPYEDSRLYLEDGKDLGIALNTEEWVSWMVEVFQTSLAICNGLVAFVVGHGKGARKWTGGPALLEADLIRKGIILRRTCYYKRNGIMGSGGNDWLRADIERIICASNSVDKLPWSDNKACGHPPKYGPGGQVSHRRKDGKRVSEVTTTTGKSKNGDTITKKVSRPVLDIVNPGDVIECVVGGGHMGSNISHDNEAPFQIKLPLFFVKSFCKPGGVVLDPFMGSGTTADAAIKTGRKYIGIDLRESQLELQKRRVKQSVATKGFGLF